MSGLDPTVPLLLQTLLVHVERLERLAQVLVDKVLRILDQAGPTLVGCGLLGSLLLLSLFLLSDLGGLLVIARLVPLKYEQLSASFASAVHKIVQKVGLPAKQPSKEPASHRAAWGRSIDTSTPLTK